MTHVVVQASPESGVGLQFYGGAREFWRYKGQEVILDGPYETGKTMATLTKLHALLCKYPNTRALMLRKTYKSLVQSALVTYEKKVLPFPPEDERSGVKKFGGNKPEWFDYPNGSRLVVGGLDKAENVLSAEYDYIYVNQAEELTLHDWEQLTGRATGRAGNAPYPQVMADCNPGPPTHWILSRASLKRFRQLHEHNPTLFNQETGQITDQGKRSLAVLDALTGVRHKRGRLGMWVSAEGQVLDTFDEDVHMLDWFEIPKDWRRFRAVDFGFTNPFVCHWWAIDPDGRMYRYREIYMTQRLVEDHADQILRLSAGLDVETWSSLSKERKARAVAQGEKIETTVADHDAEDRATLKRHGIPTVAAKKEISVGLQALQARLKIAGDGKPRIFFLRDALVEPDPTLYRERPGDLHPCCTEHEFAVYIWAPGTDGRPNKETPVDLNNHGIDTARYAVRYADEGSGSGKPKAVRTSGLYGRRGRR